MDRHRRRGLILLIVPFTAKKCAIRPRVQWQGFGRIAFFVRGEPSSILVAFSCLAVFGRTRWASDHFLRDLLAFPTRIVAILLLAFLRWLTDHHDICPGTIRILFAAPFHDKALARSLGRHDAMTQLAAEHGIEPIDKPSGWLTSQEVLYAPNLGRN